MVTVKRRSFTIAEKMNIIDRLEGGSSNKNVCKDLRIRQSTLSTIWKSRARIKDLFRKNMRKNKKIKSSYYKDVEDALLDWYQSQRIENIPVNRRILQEKAREFAKNFNKPNFECSPSWISRFRQRHNLDFGRVLKKKSAVESDTTEYTEEADTKELAELEDRKDIIPKISMISTDSAPGPFIKEEPPYHIPPDEERCDEPSDDEDTTTTIEKTRLTERDVAADPYQVYGSFGRYVTASLLQLPEGGRVAAEVAICRLLIDHKLKAFAKGQGSL